MILGDAAEPELTSKEMAKLQRKIDETTKSIAEVRELLAVENEDLKQLDDGMCVLSLSITSYYLDVANFSFIFPCPFRIWRRNPSYQQRVQSHEREKY